MGKQPKGSPLFWFYGSWEDADREADEHGPNLVTMRKSRVSDGWLIEVF